MNAENAQCQQDALGGNSKTVVVANVAPAAGSARETLSTLGFAQRAKQARGQRFTLQLMAG